MAKLIFENREISDSDFSNFPKLDSPVRSMVSVISPTYNEAENLFSLIERLADVMGDRKYEVIIVDDNSQDGTIEIVNSLSTVYPVKLLCRPEKLGLASAILTGFRFARGNILGVIDADLQHPPRYILNFVDALEHEDCDLVIGSRYVTGGGIESWSTKRALISKLAVLLAKPLVRDINDPMSGFIFLKRKVLEGVEFAPSGFKLGLEILVKGNYKNVKEIPYVFNNRKNGKSKLNKKEIQSYLLLLKNLYAYKLMKQKFNKV